MRGERYERSGLGEGGGERYVQGEGGGEGRKGKMEGMHLDRADL